MPDMQSAALNSPEQKKTTHRRWRFQYSLRTLLIVVTILAVIFSWLGVHIRRAQQQSRIVAKIKMLDGGIRYESGYFAVFSDGKSLMSGNSKNKMPGIGILKWIFGDDIFEYVTRVCF
jgi:hypothetical protein